MLIRNGYSKTQHTDNETKILWGGGERDEKCNAGTDGQEDMVSLA